MKLKNSEGIEFWLCFQRNFKDSKSPNQLNLELFITGDVDAEVKIEIDGIGFKTNVFVPGGTIMNVKLPQEAQVKSDEMIERLAVHIISDKAISVYGLNRRYQTTDTYLGLPNNVLGTEYRAMGYNVSEGLMSHFAIVATENGTEIMITPSVNTNIHKALVPYKINLSKGDVYQVAARYERQGLSDITGTLIKSNKKIAVFSGHQCAYVPSNIMACNHLVEQMPPIPSWGKHFYLGMLYPRSKYTFRVLANENGTRIFVDAKLIRILNAGDFWDSVGTKTLQITANKPILVAQYSQGFKNGDSIGDPMMLLASPTQQFLRHYRFATPINGFWKHMINVVVPKQGIPSMRLDGRKIDSVLFKPLGISRYAIAYIEVPYGSHTIEGGLPFGMYSYGFGYGNDAYDAYGTMAGQSFVDYEPAADTLPPMGDSQFKENLMSAVFRDDREDDTGIKDVTVVDNIGMELEKKNIEEGTPQVQLNIKALSRGEPGRIVLSVRDIALNESIFTVCYFFDGKTDKWVYIMNPGIIDDCMPDPGFLIGTYAKINVNMHQADFRKTGSISGQSNFTSASKASVLGGLLISRRLMMDFNARVSLSFDSYSGTLTSPDTVIQSVRLPDGRIAPYQEARELTLDGISMHFSLAGEYIIRQNLYAIAGLDFGISLSNRISFNRALIQPDFGGFDSTGSRREPIQGSPSNLENINSIRLGLFAGIGINIPINYTISAFAETYYLYPITGIISDGDWFLHRISMLLGIKYRI